MGAKITSFMYALILISVIAVGFSLYFVGLADGYNLDYDNTSLEAFNQLDAMNDKAEEIKGGVNDIKEKTGILDIIGGYFSSAYKVLLLTKGSYDTFDTMSNEAIEQANLGEYGKYLKLAIGAMILIFVFVGVILAYIVKWET